MKPKMAYVMYPYQELKEAERVLDKTLPSKFPKVAIANPTQGPDLAAKMAGMIRLKPSTMLRRLKPIAPNSQKVWYCGELKPSLEAATNKRSRR